MSTHIIDCIEDAWEAQVNLKHVCRSCGSLSRNLQDGWCPRCNGDEPSNGEMVRLELAQARERTRQAELRANRRARGEVF